MSTETTESETGFAVCLSKKENSNLCYQGLYIIAVILTRFHRFKPIKISAIRFINIKKLILKFTWKHKGIRIAPEILNRNNNVLAPNFTSKCTSKPQQDRVTTVNRD